MCVYIYRYIAYISSHRELTETKWTEKSSKLKRTRTTTKNMFLKRDTWFHPSFPRVFETTQRTNYQRRWVLLMCAPKFLKKVDLLKLSTGKQMYCFPLVDQKLEDLRLPEDFLPNLDFLDLRRYSEQFKRCWNTHGPKFGRFDEIFKSKTRF